MNKTDLVNAVAAAGFSKKDADKAVAAVFGAIEGALAKGDKVQLIGFGTFEVRERAAKEGRNPKTGETIKIEGMCRTPQAKSLGLVIFLPTRSISTLN